MVTPMSDESVKDLIITTQPIEEIGLISDENCKFVSVEEEDGKTLNVLEYEGSEGKVFLYFDTDTGLKYKQTVIAKMPDGSSITVTSDDESGKISRRAHFTDCHEICTEFVFCGYFEHARITQLVKVLYLAANTVTHIIHNYIYLLSLQKKQRPNLSGHFIRLPFILFHP